MITVPPTAEVQRLVQLVGAEAALALIEAFGGTRLYIPRVPTDRITAVISAEAAAALAQAWGGENFKVPFGREWRVLIYRGRGLSYAAIARQTGCTEATVWRILSRNEQTAHQYDLFGPHLTA